MNVESTVKYQDRMFREVRQITKDVPRTGLAHVIEGTIVKMDAAIRLTITGACSRYELMNSLCYSGKFKWQFERSWSIWMCVLSEYHGYWLTIIRTKGSCAGSVSADKMKVLPHPAYSSHLSPCDLHLSEHLKKALMLGFQTCGSSPILWELWDQPIPRATSSTLSSPWSIIIDTFLEFGVWFNSGMHVSPMVRVISPESPSDVSFVTEFSSWFLLITSQQNLDRLRLI